MKIIDFECKGNVVRFYLGKDDCNDYWGDDWGDTSYESNAGRVSSDFIVGVRDMYFQFDSLVLEPCSGAYNSSYSKEDMKKRRVPCIIVVPKELHEGEWYRYEFEYWVGADGIQKFYFGDRMTVEIDDDDDFK